MYTNRRMLGPGLWGWIAALAALFGVVALAPGAAGQEPRSGSQPPYTNPRLAQQDLEWAQQNFEAARLRLAQRTEEFDRLVSEASDLVGLEQNLVNDLVEARDQASEFIVASYVTGRFGALSAELLATDHLLDALYLQTLIAARAGTVAEAFSEYEMLLAEAGDRLVFVLDRIEVVHRDIQLAHRDIPLLEERLAEASWVVSVASIHAEAEVELARRRRIDPTQAQWEALRHCESSGNYRVNTGNGYYGAYQFDQTTWESVGGSGRPHWAEPEMQDARARLLYARRGPQPWPICGRYLP